MLTAADMDGDLLDEACDAVEEYAAEHGDAWCDPVSRDSEMDSAVARIVAGGPFRDHRIGRLIKDKVIAAGGAVQDSTAAAVDLGFWIGVRSGFRCGFVNGWANGRVPDQSRWTSSPVAAVKHRCESHGQVGFVYEYSSGRCWARPEGPDEKLGSFPDLDSARSAVEERAAQRKGG